MAGLILPGTPLATEAELAAVQAALAAFAKTADLAALQSTVTAQAGQIAALQTQVAGLLNPVSPALAGAVFADDFNGAALSLGQHMDTTKTWSAVGWDSSVWNGDPKNDAWEVNPLNPATPIAGLYAVDGSGNAVLKVDRTPSQYSAACGGKAYVSTQMVASNFRRLHGYWEVRCRMTNQQGLGYAPLWLMSNGANGHYQEIDVLEAVNPGSGTFAAQTVHYDGGQQDQAIQWAPGYDCTQFHTFGCMWDATHITFYFDRKPTAQYATPAYYTDPMFPIVSAQQGGGWSGPIPAGAPMPATLVIDYVACWDTLPFTP
jgi:beta-glucanase (GH16 family)